MLVYLVAGEASGDALGARLMAALKELSGGRVAFAGIGGPHMAEEGLDSLFPMTDLAVMGLVEVVPRAPALLRRMHQTVRDIRRRGPAILVTIDSPDFAYRVARRLRDTAMPRLHYVAPTVWAWRPRRVRTFRRSHDHVLALLPFEPPYFQVAGLPCSHVGHPVVESGLERGDRAAFRARHGIAADRPVLAVMPGSRVGEVKRLLPVFLRALGRMRIRFPLLHAVVPTVPAVAEMVGAADWPLPAIVVGGEEKADAFAASDAAIAASGTATLELALAGVPHLIAYRINPATALAVRALIRVPYVNMINLVLDRPVVPELLQSRCTPGRVAEAATRLLEDPWARDEQRRQFARAMQELGRDGAPPSRRAAQVILDIAQADLP